jgi:hypothetical protein
MAVIIRDALDYNLSLLPMDEMIPLALPASGSPFNLEVLQSAIQMHCMKAVHVQMNRRRLDTGTFSMKKEWARMKSGVAGLLHIWRDTEEKGASTGGTDPS